MKLLGGSKVNLFLHFLQFGGETHGMVGVRCDQTLDRTRIPLIMVPLSISRALIAKMNSQDCHYIRLHPREHPITVDPKPSRYTGRAGEKGAPSADPEGADRRKPAALPRPARGAATREERLREESSDGATGGIVRGRSSEWGEKAKR